MVDLKRAQNVDIGLAQFKKYSVGEIGEKIVTMKLDFPTDKLLNLQLLMPDEKEMHKVRSFEGDVTKLRKAEQFFIAMSKIERVNAKLEVVIFKASFREIMRELKERISVINSACWQVMNSAKFEAMLQKCLQVGNFMNAGSYKGGAQGFTLDSLLKLTTTRGVDKKTSVLDFIVRTTTKKSEDMLTFADDFTDIEMASRFPLRELYKSHENVKKGLEHAEKELEVTSGQKTLDPNAAEFTRALTGFCRMARQQVTELREESERLRQNAARLAEYFAENPNIVMTDEIFSKLMLFTTALRSSLKSERERKSREKSSK